MSEHTATHVLSVVTRQHELQWQPGTFEALTHAHVDGQWFPATEPDVGVPAHLTNGPVHLWAATDERRTVPLVQTVMDPCHVEVTLWREDGLVHWELSGWATGSFDFDADAYDAELARHLADRSWELPGDTVDRLLRHSPEVAALVDAGFSFAFAEYGEGGLQVALRLDDGACQYHVVITPPAGDDPQQDAALARHELRRPAGSWTCRWTPLDGSVAPPSVSGPGWERTSLRPPRTSARQRLLDAVASGLRDLDPLGAGPGAPADEYRPEAEAVADAFGRCRDADDLAHLVHEVVQAWSDPVVVPGVDAFTILSHRAWAQWQATVEESRTTRG